MINKKYYFLIVLANTVLFALLVIVPLFNRGMEYISLYRQAFVEPFPRIELDDHKLVFLDPVPVKLTVGNSVEIICEKEPDLDYFESTVQNSVLISESLLVIKTNNDIESFKISELELDSDEPIVIEPLKVSSFIHKYSKSLMILTSIVISLACFVFLLIIVVIGGGIGFMIDAFQDGNLGFTFFANISALLFLIMSGFIFLLFKMHIVLLKNPIHNLILIYLLMAGITVLIRKNVPLVNGTLED